MKKSINKVCSIALAMVSTTAVGATAIVLNPNDNGQAQIHAEQAAASLSYLTIAGGAENVNLGTKGYTLPKAQLVQSGAPTDINVSGFNPELKTGSCIKVFSPLNEEVDIVDGKIDVTRLGEYTVEYTVGDGSHVYTGTHKFTSVLGETSITFEENTSRILPKKVWLSYKGELYAPKAEVKFVNEDEALDYDITMTVTTPKNDGKMTVDQKTGKLTFENLQEGIYSVNYTAKTKEDKVFLATKTLEFEVLKDSQYSSEYELKYDLGTVPTAADVGDTITLPEPKGKREGEEVPVYYTIEAWTYENKELVNVSAREINGKKVIEGNKFTPAVKGDYVIYYNVKDALGKTAERKSISINDVEDTKAPEIKVVEPYATTTTLNLENKDYLLHSKFALGEDVVIKAMFAEDFADKLADLKLTRTIRKETQVGTSSYIYSEEDEKVSNFNKDLVFTTGEKQDTETQKFVKKELEAGKYTVTYKAKDSSGNVSTVNYTFNITSESLYTKKPTVKFKDTFAKSVKPGDVIKFSAPEAKDDNDERLLTEVYVKYDEGNWELLNKEKDGSYKLKVKQDANKLSIRAKTINDAPMTEAENTADEDPSLYEGFKYGYDEVAITIASNKDATAPELVSLGDLGAYTQNTEVTLPDIVLNDDMVDYLNVNVKVEHIETKQDFSVYDGAVVRTGSVYTLSGAKFYANLAGKYNVTYVAEDAARNQICINQEINVTGAETVETPRFANLPESLVEGKLELGKEVVLPVPEIKVPSSLDAEYRLQVKGPMNYKLNKEKFVPQEAGTYTIAYSLWTKATGTGIENFAEQTDARKEFVVVVSDTIAPTVRVVWDLQDVYLKDESAIIPVFEATDESGINLETSNVKITSDHISRTIYAKDFAEELKKEDSGLLKQTFNYNERYTVTYTVFDKSNNSNSTVKSYTIKVGDLVAPVIEVKDDIIASTLKIDSVLSIDTDKIVGVTDNITDMKKSDIKITVKNTTTNKVVENIHEPKEDEEFNGKYEYNIETAGTYTVTFSAKDANGNTGKVERTFTVSEPSSEPMDQTAVIGTVLIVVAVLVLGGVIVYFIVSKKKLDKMYK